MSESKGKGRSRMLDRLGAASATAKSKPQGDGVLPQNPPDDSSLMGEAFDRLRGAESENRTNMVLHPTDFITNWNPREIPLTTSEVRSIKWPSLDADSEDIDGAIEAALVSFFEENQSVRERIPDWSMNQLVEFFHDIHLLSVSIFENGQSQNVVCYRDTIDYAKYVLIAGERRITAFAYGNGSGAKMPDVNALVYMAKPDPLQLAIIQDHENTQSKTLNFYETVRSKWGIYQAYTSTRGAMSVSEAVKQFGYNTRSMPSVLCRLFARDDCEEVIAAIKTHGMGARELEDFVKSEQAETSKAVLRKNSNSEDAKDKPAKASERAAAETEEFSQDIHTPDPVLNKPTSVGSKIAALSEAGEEKKQKKKELKDIGFTIAKSTDRTLLNMIFKAASGKIKLTKEQKQMVTSCLDANNDDEMIDALLSLKKGLEV